MWEGAQLMTRRRTKGTGSVYQRKDGSWVAQFEGTYRYARTETEARRKLRTLLRPADDVPSSLGERAKKPKGITVAAALDDYLETAKRKLKPRTVERYQQVIDIYLKPALGTVRLHKLTALQVEDLYAKCSPATAQLAHAVLSSTLKRAVRRGRLHTNVCSNVERPKSQQDEVEVFTYRDVVAMLSAASQDRLEALWTLALTTGMRHGEILGLQVRDYDAGKGTLAICRTVYNNVVGTPKSRRSRRTITLPRRALEALQRHTAGPTWMFEKGAGNPLRNNTFVTRLWRPFLQRAGVEYKNFHTCRHYVASTLLSKGLPITAVARYMGHDEKTLLSTYSHMMPDMMDTVASAMDIALHSRERET
jgi:integrase